MKRIIALLCLTICLANNSAHAKHKPTMELNSLYVETMNPNNATRNIIDDYGMISSESEDQSSKLQSAIDDLAQQGGGNLIIPNGTYCFSRINMKSNIHILVADGTIFRPAGAMDSKIVMINFSADNSANEQAFIENCSIRCLEEGGRYIVDYSDREPVRGSGIRFIVAKMVKNFYIADADIRDNYTIYCAMCFTPTGSKDVEGAKKWVVSRPTNGEIRNCSIDNASPGYGLLQCHGAQSLYFENLYSEGGVALRLETGANTPQIGVYDIMARNIRCENGKCTLLMGPHISKNGSVRVDGVWAKSCNFAVQAGEGVTSGTHKGVSNVTPGSFEDSRVINVHAIFGTNTQLKVSTAWYLEPELFKYIHRAEIMNQTDKWSIGPSCAAVIDKTDGTYNVTWENVTTEGFEYNVNKVLTADDVRTKEKNKASIMSQLKELL